VHLHIFLFSSNVYNRSFSSLQSLEERVTKLTMNPTIIDFDSKGFGWWLEEEGIQRLSSTKKHLQS
jgi:hypothetical protein